MSARRIAVVGGGWAGLAAAVQATLAGHRVSVWEAARTWGGRARALAGDGTSASESPLDNGQHILIGAYSSTLDLMRTVGADPDASLLRLPLCMQFPNGDGIRLPNWPVPLDVAAAVLSARGWSRGDKVSLLRTTLRWQLAGFVCPTAATVADLCRTLTPTVMQTLLEPLCVSALNTPPERASGQVFLRVLKDSLMGGRGSSNLLLPRTDLTRLFPLAAATWLENRGVTLRLGQRVQNLAHNGVWRVEGEDFDAVVLATSASTACQLLPNVVADAAMHSAIRDWTQLAQSLQYEAIATVYVQAGNASLPRPLLALRSDAANPAQFVFDRGQLGGPPGLLAFVVSASQGERDSLQHAVLRQARSQLAALLDVHALHPVQTIVEKRATFACTPGLVRPGMLVAPGLLACGDYVDGPYPATLEGAVRSGTAAAAAFL